MEQKEKEEYQKQLEKINISIEEETVRLARLQGAKSTLIAIIEGKPILSEKPEEPKK